MHTKLILTLTLLASFICLTAYQHGTALTAGLNCTGSGGSVAGCSGNGCHAANNSNTHVLLFHLLDSTQSVTEYIPGHTYTVYFNAENEDTSKTLPQFGFQLSAVTASNTNQQAGSFDTANAGSPVIIQSVNNIQLVEQSRSTNSFATVNGHSLYASSITWTAPATNVGPVTFYLVVNAVDGDTTELGDQPNAYSVTIQSPLQVEPLSTAPGATIYPCPAKNDFTVRVRESERGAIMTVTDMHGRLMLQKQLNGITTHVEIDQWAAGLYQCRFSKDGKVFFQPVLKL